MFSIAAAVSKADQPTAIPGARFEAAFAVRAVIDGHAMRMNRHYAPAGIEVALSAASRRDTGSRAVAVEVMTASIRVSHAPASARRGARSTHGARRGAGGRGGTRVGMARGRVGARRAGMGRRGISVSRVCM